jgi:hypothetical protein
VLAHWVKNVVYLLYARFGLVSQNIISVFYVRSFLTGKVPRLLTRELSQPLCRHLLPRRVGFNEGIYTWDLWCTKWHTGSTFSKLLSFPFSIILPILRLYTLPSYLPEGQAGGAWKHSNSVSLASPNIYTEDLEITKNVEPRGCFGQ